MKRIVKKHHLAIRWFHWVNFPVLFIMIWSGTLIYWANDIYRIRIGGYELIHFYPQSIYNLFTVPYHLAEGMAWHFVFMWVFFINGLLYVTYTLFSGEWRLLLPRKESFKLALQVTLHDLHLRKQKPPQSGKYNDAQRMAYTLIIIMGIGSLLSGLAIYKPTQFSFITAIMGGYMTARLIHFSLTIGYVLFFLIHVIQVILAGWQNFRGMVAGFEVEKVEEEKILQPEKKEDKTENKLP